MRYRFLMDLFGSELNRDQFKERFKISLNLGLPFEMIFFFLNGALDLSDSKVVRLTAKGEYLFVVIMREFFTGINNIRDQARATLTPQDGTGEQVCIPEQAC